MNVISNTPRKTILSGVALAVAALMIALLAVSYAAGPAWADTPDKTDAPKPCGPGAQDAPDNPDATITQGHYGVFDGYWDSEKNTLNINLCPPAVMHHLETRTDPVTYLETQVEVSKRTKSNVDIRRTVIHIDHIDGIPEGEQFKHTLTAADVEKYDFLKMGDANNDNVDDAVGQSVWWLKVDDEDTPDVDEDSPLAMGFSAALFDSNDWYKDDGTQSKKGLKPLQYEFEVIREPGIPVDEQGHVFAFDDSDPVGRNPKTAYWDSSEVDANALPLYPGDYHHFQWVFTKPGTYVVSVQLKGHVRQKASADAPEGWQPLSSNSVETSEVRQYVFQIGPLTLNEDPAFVVERSVRENSAIGTLVGDAIPVYAGDDDDLTFTLSGPGHSLFSATSTAGGAQIKVAGDLNYEARPEYRLTLGVSDNKDREGNPDERVDNTIAVHVTLTDQPEAERSVAENAAEGTDVGAAIVVAGASASTTYSLSGQGEGLFTVERDSGNNAQIKVAAGAVLNYEDAQSYVLTLTASDGDNVQEIRVTISVEDDPNEQLSLTVTANPSGATQTVGTQVTFTGTVANSPVATSELLFSWWERDRGGASNALAEDIHTPYWATTWNEAGTREYGMRAWYPTGNGNEISTAARSNTIVIEWQAAAGQ